nr:UvrD-like helicase, ATP-binding domain, P-loop containing nucleoside triphosphate hydrolase [Tanacetum cinerariifolium]
MSNHRSKEDDMLQIFTSLFVTNFPDQTNAKELWRISKQYGNVIDVFIPNRRSKSGWAPNFNTQDDLIDSDDESVDAKNDGNQKNVNSEAGSEVDEIPETLFEQAEDCEIRSTAIKDNHKDGSEDAQSDDPFNIYVLLNKKLLVKVHQSEGEDNQMKEIPRRKNDFNASIVSIRNNRNWHSMSRDYFLQVLSRQLLH